MKGVLSSIVCVFSILFSTLISTSYGFADDVEREALLEFKRNLIDPSNRLVSWSNSSRDCCMWAGVVCDNSTGHVTALLLQNPSVNMGWQGRIRSKLRGKVISPSLLNLTHLKHLDLSSNDFEGIQIPTFLGSINSLRSLHLSNAGFHGEIPNQLGNLSNLQHLDIMAYDEGDLYVERLHWLSGLHSLKYLDLGYVNLEKARDWLQVTSTLPSLVELHLSDCFISNVQPPHIANFSSLTTLDLSGNDINPLMWVFDLTSLISLHLRESNLQGPIPEGLQNLTSLKYLDLSKNRLSSIPDWFCNFHYLESVNLEHNYFDIISSSPIHNLTSLNDLDLSHNHVDEGFLTSLGNLCNLQSISMWSCSLRIDLSKVLKSLSGCVPNKLESLDLSDNQLSGQLSVEIGNFQKLTTLYLYNNSLSGPIPAAITKLSSLEYLFLDDNKFNGSFQVLFPIIPKLRELRIRNNLLEGEITEIHFENATKLKELDISNNFLNFKVTSLWIPPFQLTRLGLRSCNLDSEFPPWVRSQKYLHYLDISSAKLSGSIPSWFWNMVPQIFFVNISHNHFHGHIPSLVITYSNSLMMDLSSNNFHGILPRFQLKYLIHLDLSNNSLSGSISHLLCVQPNRQNHLVNLFLNRNNLSGELPNCWERWPNLSAIDLKNNNFIGNIPSSMGNLTWLTHLHLGHNKFFGGLPSSLSSCSILETIDVGGNQLVGSIPPWIGESLTSLRILNLRSNKFHNYIPDELCALVSLQVLDLANNSLSGTVPQCFSNFTIMASKNSTSDFYDYYEPAYYPWFTYTEGAEITTKGASREYSTILKLMKVIDISCNKLSGELPVELTSLHDLQSLNLSNNLLTGMIPENIGLMTSLESLDLSANKLCGEIPSSMSELNYLQVLDLSNNKLNGKIPESTQLQSMNESSFDGNELCGPPLTINCISETHDNSRVGENPEDEKKFQLDWFYVSMGLGFIVGFWSSAGSLFLSRPWRIIFFGFVDRIWLQVLLFITKCKSVNMFRF